MIKRRHRLLLIATILLTFPVSVAFGLAAGYAGLLPWATTAPAVRLAGPPPLFVYGAHLITAPGARVELRAITLPDSAGAETLSVALAPGVSGVRIVTDPAHYLEDEPERDRVAGLVAAAAEAGIYPMVAAAPSPGGQCGGDGDSLPAFWSAVAAATAAWPATIYDIGDAGCGNDWDRTRAAAAATIDTIRQVAPAALVVVAAPEGLTPPLLAESRAPREGLAYRLQLAVPEAGAPASPPALAGMPVLLEPPALPDTDEQALHARMVMSDIVAAHAGGWVVPPAPERALAAAVRTALAGAARAASPEAEPLPRLRAAGNRVVDTNGRVVRLAGFNRPGLEVFQELDAGPTQEDLDRMAALGANLLRLPVNPVWYRTRPAYRAVVEAVITWAEERRLYTLLDLHWSTPNGEAVCWPEMATATRFWQEAAFDLRGRTSVVYDLYNEPCKMDWAAWRPLAEQLVDAVRAVEPDALVVAPGVDWAYDLRGVADAPVRRDNLVYRAHDYPWKVYLDREQAYGYLADRYPVLLGEFGADYQPRYGFYQDPVEFTRGLLEYVDRRGLVGWVAWAWHADITPKMFSDWQFTPTPFGQTVLDHLAASAAAAPGTTPVAEPEPQAPDPSASADSGAALLP